MIVPKHFILPEQLFQSFCAFDPVQIPHGMRQFIPKLRGGEWIFFLGRQGMEELLDLVLMDETPCFVGGKEFVEVKGVIHRAILAGKVQPLLDPLPDHG